MGIKDFNRYKLGLIFGLLLIFIAIPAAAESGSFDSVGVLISQSYSMAGGGSSGNISGIYLMNIQNQTGLQYITDVVWGGSADHDSSGTAVNLYAGDTVIGDGYLGYSYSGVTSKYTVYLTIGYLDIGTRTGNQFINFSPISTSLIWQFDHLVAQYNVLAGDLNAAYFSTNGNAKMSDIYIKYQSQEFHNTYTTSYTAPQSTITVTKLIGSEPYPSKVYIMQGTTVLASNTTLTSLPFSTIIAGAPYFTINVTDMWGNWYVSPYIYGSGTTPGYNISVSPSNITPTTSASGGITSLFDTTLSALTDISWKWSDDTGTYNFYEGGNTSRLMDYTKKANTHWYGYEIGTGGLGGSYNLDKGTNVPNPVTLANIPTTGTKTIICFIGTSDGHWYELTANLTVSGGGVYTTTRAAMVDWISGNRIYYGTISWQNIATGVWTNITPSTGDGSVSVSSPPTTKWDIYGSASGYAISSLLSMPSTDTGIYTLFMYPQANITAAGGQTTLYVFVEDADTLGGIGNAQVTVSSVADQSYNQLKSTASSGAVTFYVPNNTEYWVGAQAAGYFGVMQKVTVAAEPMISQHIALHRKTVAPTPTVTEMTVVPTPTATIPGYVPATGNFTGFWAPFLNLGVAMGADPNEVGILMALVLSFGGLILGSIGPSMFTGTIVISPIGGEIGSFLGIAGSVAFGFFPLYLSIIVVVGLILYVSLRVYGVTR
jgi:hypothetical protein